jgi:hypothetical protein
VAQSQYYTARTWGKKSYGMCDSILHTSFRGLKKKLCLHRKTAAAKILLLFCLLGGEGCSPKTYFEQVH